MKVYIGLVIIIIGTEVIEFLLALPHTKNHIINVKHSEGVGGTWKTRTEWKAEWMKEWIPKKVYEGIWKKVWTPVIVKEWFPFLKPPLHGWNPH